MKTGVKKKWSGRLIRVRRGGMVYIVVSIVLGVVSVNSANNLLYMVTAMMLGYMLASGIAGRANIRGASVSLTFPDEIYAFAPCAVVVNVRNKNRFTPIFLIEVALTQRSGRSSAFFPVVQPGRTESRTIFTIFPSRGRSLFEGIELSSVYPFNFFVRYWPVEASSEVVVFPYPMDCDPEAVFRPSDDSENEEETADLMAETDIVGVRPYIEGDSMKRIHWKSSARTGKLQTRLYDGASSRRRRVIDLDRLVYGGVERGLSMAAYAVVESIKSGLPIGMKSGSDLIRPASGYAHKKALLTRLALYGEQ